jgi:hypothetical protein
MTGVAAITLFDTILDRIGRLIARRLQKPVSGYEPFTPSDPVTLRRVLQPGDILLVEGNQKLSTAIKYLTQSTWSHAAIYVGDALGKPPEGGEARSLIEVTIAEGAVAVPLSKYMSYNTRICRPVGLSVQDRAQVLAFMIDRLGTSYDMRHIFDLMRYLLPTPPVPTRWRRRMIAFGSGDPTRAICSSLIAQAFGRIRYPILPVITREFRADELARSQRSEILHIRHHSLYAPRDFDLSPYFQVVKPTLESGFDYRRLKWSDQAPAPEPLAAPSR